MTIKAVYQNGVFRPLKPIVIQEGTEVEVTLTKPRQRPTPEEVKHSFLRIADMPLEEGESFSGRDHDKILYGDPKQS